MKKLIFLILTIISISSLNAANITINIIALGGGTPRSLEIDQNSTIAQLKQKIRNWEPYKAFIANNKIALFSSKNTQWSNLTLQGFFQQFSNIVELTPEEMQSIPSNWLSSGELDDNKTLKDYNIVNNDTIGLIVTFSS